jgi:hypothetical protein
MRSRIKYRRLVHEKFSSTLSLVPFSASSSRPSPACLWTHCFNHLPPLKAPTTLVQQHPTTVRHSARHQTRRRCKVPSSWCSRWLLPLRQRPHSCQPLHSHQSPRSQIYWLSCRVSGSLYATSLRGLRRGCCCQDQRSQLSVIARTRIGSSSTPSVDVIPTKTLANLDRFPRAFASADVTVSSYAVGHSCGITRHPLSQTATS